MTDKPVAAPVVAAAPSSEEVEAALAHADKYAAWRNPHATAMGILAAEVRRLREVAADLHRQRCELWERIGATRPTPRPCTCGFGGSHDDVNPHCERNKEKP